ncbi:S-layer homology domain-containing protein [Calothrix sp. 336/3]|uniref:S-layer homology domain-containing protein n=1 Tax=Calothrix sp. 336/3 TaxID=1337936 RepID=UPI0004E45B5E|nr:S-layer homology domain-containing protein [Calothrix sp. 336/3]AKG20529.1 parallel beta-helix repeat-containing protein [Calothrix sp. 336/3]
MVNIVTTIYVNPQIGNDINSGSRSRPYKTLTRALQGGKGTKFIQLAPGTYSTANGEVFPLIVPSGVMVVGNEATKGQGILISGSGEYESLSFGVQNVTILLLGDSSLMGVTVSNSTNKGTAIWVESTLPTLANNTFSNCGREGIFVTGKAKPSITDNVFVNNGASGLVMARSSKGEILRNLFRQNPMGIAISDTSAPLLVSNKFIDNKTAIALSRDARPVLRQNLLENNFQGGLLVNGNAQPDLGSTQEPANNVFRNNGQFDIQNATSDKLLSAGNSLNPSLVKGAVEFSATTEARNPTVTVSTTMPDMMGHWATAFVEALVSQGFLTGMPDGSFAPESAINRAQYAAVIAKTFQIPEKNKISNFTDIKPDFWAAKAIYKAAAMGFISGFPDGSFRPGQNLTRIQAIVSLVNGLQWRGGNQNLLTMYGDRSQIPSYAYEAVAIATEKLLITNYPQTDHLQPLRDITRAEVAALIYQALVANSQQKPVFSPYIVTPDQDISSFTDLTGHWAEPFIRALASMNITRGFTDGSYRPDTPMSRADYANIVATALNPSPKRPGVEFSDVPQSFWAYRAIQQAARGGFVGGFSDRTFRPQQNVQRLQVIVSLVNGLSLPPAANTTVLTYSDSTNIPESVRTVVATATIQRIVVNYPDIKQIQPTKEATRGEVAAMIYQALVAIGRVSAINSPYIVSPLAFAK